jgi:hypothetical protein
MRLALPALPVIALLLSAAEANACQIDWPTSKPQPTWDESVAEADILFIGRVATILPSFRYGWSSRVIFLVEDWIRGENGVLFETEQGSGGDCRNEFLVGDRVIFAGDGFFDPTFTLSAPPTKEDLRRLEFVRSQARD